MLRYSKKKIGTKYILLYSPFFNDKSWMLPLNGSDIVVDYFVQQQCPISDCIITINKELLKSITDYDAILFPAVSAFFEKPDLRNPNQIYIMGINEPPSKTIFDFSKVNNFFNWTMTYRLDSDIVWSYSRIIDMETKEMFSHANFTGWRVSDIESFHDDNYLNITKRKTKLAAIFVSNCHVPSKRDKLVAALQRYIPVDVYGKCGPLKCGVISWETDKYDGCHRMVEDTYKFYFSFENDLCLDYVTEKLFATMNFSVIPVVYGGANYSLFAPPKSYINFNDFATVKDLADYLIYLDQNPLEYIKYFWYKKKYRFATDNMFFIYCDLCKKLHDQQNMKIKRTYNDMGDWWGNKFTKCYPKPRNFN